MAVFNQVNKDKLKLLLEHGFHLDKPQKYETTRLKGPGSVILFESGKLLVQGNDDVEERIGKLIVNYKIAKAIKHEFNQTSGTVIGSDETLKGDTFGGIVVAGVKVNDKQRDKLRLLTVQDSKKLSEEQIIASSKMIKQFVDYKVISFSAKRYNEYTETANVSKLLNDLHKQVQSELGKGKHIVDQYPGCTVGDVIETKADSKYLEVAAASILAREEALMQLDSLSKKLGITVPKGSSHVTEALLFLKKSKKDPTDFVKMHFKNVKAVF
jgi:ribonuclease HIII